MAEFDQFQIIQGILGRVISVVEEGWREMIIDFYVEGGHSAVLKSYLIEKDGRLDEEALGYVPDLDVWMRKLQVHLAQAGRPPFTRCKIHVTAAGKYDVAYGYEKVDWDALVTPDWNFLPKKNVDA